MITFYPNWLTPSGNIANVTENQSVSISLDAVRSAQFMGSEGVNSTQFDLTNSDYTPNLIDGVYVNNISVSFSIFGNTLILANSISNTDVVTINTSDTLTYSLLHDSLPTGLSFSNTGIISGTVTTLPTVDEQKFTFTVRISDGKYVRDREFSMIANIANPVPSPPNWGNLPSENIKTGNPSFSYIPLGNSTRSTLFEYQLNIFEPNGVPPTLVTQDFLNSPEIIAPFNSIPSGLSVNPNTGLIKGIVSPDVLFGDYYFNILMKDFFGNPISYGMAATPITFKITIEPSNTSLQPFRLIEWNTPAGLLASMYEAQSFPLSVNAICTTGENVTYSIVNNTSLPPGLTLNSTNGNIEGNLAHVSNINQTFNFTIRANVLNVFADRDFSITVLSKYKSAAFLDFYLKMRMVDAIPMANYYSNLISPSYYFRNNDSNFGILQTGSLNLYLVGGLNGTVTTISQNIRSSSIDGPLTLMLGDHKIANATINGNTIYEVLYREVMDPMSGAGGYIDNNGIPIKETLVYPESKVDIPIYLYPNSINNIRSELALTLGFPSYNTKLLGINSAENLPLWMACPQHNNDPATAIGYISAIVIAYLIPGTGQSILDAISNRSEPAELPMDSTDPIRNGHVVEFDQYYVSFDSTSNQTTFDLNTLTFDTTTTFDSFPYTGSQLFRINRATNNTTS